MVRRLTTHDTLESWKFSIAVIVILFLVIGLQWLGGELLLVGLVGCLAVFGVPFSPWILLFFLAGLLGLPVIMSEMPITLLGIRVYGADLILYLLAVALLRFMMSSKIQERVFGEEAEPHVRKMCWLMLIMFAYGFIPMIHGFIAGHEANNILGDFRRLYFYPLALFVPLFLPIKSHHLKFLWAVLIIGGILAIAMGAYRLITDSSWQEDYFLSGHTGWEIQARRLSQFEIATLGLFIALLTALIKTTSQRWLKVLSIFPLVLAVIFLLLSGWRLALIYLVLCPTIAYAFIAWMRNERILPGPKSLLFIAILLVVGAIIGGVFFDESLQNTLHTLYERTKEKDFTEDQRYYAWRQTLSHAKENPVIGIGIGHVLEFYQMSSTGEFIWNSSTAHNAYLDRFYQTGIIGIGLFLYFHYLFIRYIFYKARQIQTNAALLVGMFSGYISILAVNSLQPLQTGAAVVFNLLIGLMLLLVTERLQISNHAGQSEEYDCLAQIQEK